MRDRFFEVSKCDRCHGSLDGGRILSMYNDHDVLCMKCKEAERQRADYQNAVEADNVEIRKGNFNYRGIYNEEDAQCHF